MITSKEISETTEFTEIYNTLSESEPYKSDEESKENLLDIFFFKATTANPEFINSGIKLANMYEEHLQSKSEQK